jgi:hypothetical protein
VASAIHGPPFPFDPLDPDTDPWPPWAKVREVEVEVDPVPLREEDE